MIFRPREGRTEPLPIAADEVALGFDDTGRHLYVGCSRDGGRCIERLDLQSGTRTPWGRLQPPDPTGILYTGHPVVTPRGHRYAYSFLRLLSDLYLVDGIA